MKNVSVIHGFALSAWAWAGLCGNQLGNYILTNYGLNHLLFFLISMYCIAASITTSIILQNNATNK
jgi:OFA family oxalate/formate antiporter-like MFS transporter